MKQVSINMSLEQAKVVEIALDLFARVSIGQLDAISMLVSTEGVPMMPSGHDDARKPKFPGVEECARVDSAINEAMRALGYFSGSSLGIGHEMVSTNGKRAWEIKKVIAKALAEDHDPNPRFRGTNYEGLTVRYTADTAPEVSING